MSDKEIESRLGFIDEVLKNIKHTEKLLNDKKLKLDDILGRRQYYHLGDLYVLFINHKDYDDKAASPKQLYQPFYVLGEDMTHNVGRFKQVRVSYNEVLYGYTQTKRPHNEKYRLLFSKETIDANSSNIQNKAIPVDLFKNMVYQHGWQIDPSLSVRMKKDL